MIVDAKDAIAGRLAAYTAKQLLKGESIHIINAERAIITGDPVGIEQKYKERRERGSPQHGPFYPKSPDMLLRRMIRGMLPYKQPKGRVAFKKLRVHIGTPEDLKTGEKMLFAEKQKAVECKFMRIGDLSKKIGWSG
jgi:large subunit ribosomal protein L13